MYKALYRKWRPKVFEDVLSQPHVTKTLQNELKTGRIGHAYLFTGSRGTGKTTCAKIFAMAVNCEHPHEDGSPCLECACCKGIEQGSLLDVAEIDAASNNGVEDIRRLREEAGYTPAVCKYRVYIIDEVHMLSGSAFNALLKIMEEPPAHVIFILATTEVHKVPATILSRCQRFDFHRVRAEDIAKRILYIASQEPFTVTEEAAEMIAKLADGGMRDALSLLDQCAAYDNDIDLKTVSMAAGIADRSYLAQFADAVSAQNAAAALGMVDELYRQSRDLGRLCEELLTYYRNLMVVKTVKQPQGLVLCMPEELEQLKQQAQKTALPEILYALLELQSCLDRMSGSSSKRTEFEMCMVRLCSPQLNSTSEAILARLDRLETQLKAGGFQAGAADRQNAASAAGASSVTVPEHAVEEQPVFYREEPRPHAEPVQSEKNAFSGRDEAPAPAEQERMEPAHEEPSPVQPEQPASAEKPAGEAASAVLLDCWPEILERLSKTDPPLCGLLNGSTAYLMGDSVCIISNSNMLSSMLRKDGAAGRLSEAIAAQLGKKYRLRVRSANASAQKKEDEKHNQLAKLLKTAEESGVEVHLK